MPDHEEEIRALMRDIARAFIEGDVALLDRVFADDFTFADPEGGMVSKKAWLADVASGDLKVEGVESNEMELRQAGEMIRVRGELTLRARYSKGNYNGTFRYMGVYARQGETWRLVLTSARRADGVGPELVN
jgi:ketosteroid isomerase-like protein